MNSKRLFFPAALVILALLAGGVLGALAQRNEQPPLPAGLTLDTEGSGIGYQGRLASSTGASLDGSYTMRFFIYDQDAGGTSLWDSGAMPVAVSKGLFNVVLDVDQADFSGQPLWLEIRVSGETLSPRQPLLPAPYALSLKPGADMIGTNIAPADAVLAGYAPATGTALLADAAGGAGLYAGSDATYGVWGASQNGWGGFFTSENGHGIRVNTDGGDHYDHGAYITAAQGYAVLAQSENNMAVRGEAGNLSDIIPPLGTVGVAGLGANRGVYGASRDGSGVFGRSSGNYGVWGSSDTYRGVTGRTDRSDNNYGLYTPDNLFSNNIHTSGALMHVMRNNGQADLAPGDVVTFNGVERASDAVDGPLLLVEKAGEASSTSVAGVVFSRFNIDALDPALEGPDGETAVDPAAREVTPAGSAAPGEYLLVVVQGPALVTVDAAAAAGIQAGDLLVASDTPGMVIDAAETALGSSQAVRQTAVLGTALESYDGAMAQIYVYVTLP
ncbi:MAG: hypothetical protein ACK2UK_00150 [Candidatus Promineifilaceae bacterium]